MLPFFFASVDAPNVGLGWVLPPTFFVDHPTLLALRGTCIDVLRVLTFVAPLLLMVRVYQRSGSGLPLISVLLVFTNGVWWVAFPYLQAFGWATIFHGVQYMAIVIIFHLKDHPPPPGRRAGWLLPTLKFYGICVVVGYALFDIWPYFYVWAGFSFAESMLLCIAVINIHHFVVDRGIWRVRRDPNYRIVVSSGSSGGAPPAAVPRA
jgi:hypothetical protein